MKQLEQTLTSLEVAEMVGKDHHKLLRDIRSYIEQFSQSKIGQSDFFIESTYKTERGREYPCYLVTKKGCEFIAHKLTGTKGTAFTARYINRFHDMEQALQQEQAPFQLPSKKTYLLKNSQTWFQRNNWKMKMICDYFGWRRKFLYHKILHELSDIYKLELIEEVYISHYGYPPQYKTELLEFNKDLGHAAERYIDFIFAEIEE